MWSVGRRGASRGRPALLASAALLAGAALAQPPALAGERLPHPDAQVERVQGHSRVGLRVQRREHIKAIDVEKHLLYVHDAPDAQRAAALLADHEVAVSGAAADAFPVQGLDVVVEEARVAAQKRRDDAAVPEKRDLVAAQQQPHPEHREVEGNGERQQHFLAGVEQADHAENAQQHAHAAHDQHRDDERAQEVGRDDVRVVVAMMPLGDAQRARHVLQERGERAGNDREDGEKRRGQVPMPPEGRRPAPGPPRTWRPGARACSPWPPCSARG